MKEFPISKLQPLKATLFEGALGEPFIEVFFAQFSIPDPTGEGDELLEFNTSLRADFIKLPTIEPSELQNQSFDFPTNPEDGYIDASVYFAHVHNPVDITRIEFGKLKDGQLLLEITSRWVLSFEGPDFDDFDYTFSVPLTL